MIIIKLAVLMRNDFFIVFFLLSFKLAEISPEQEIMLERLHVLVEGICTFLDIIEAVV